VRRRSAEYWNEGEIRAGYSRTRTLNRPSTGVPEGLKH
jgi:hypothetical protein